METDWSELVATRFSNANVETAGSHVLRLLSKRIDQDWCSINFGWIHRTGMLRPPARRDA
jgi:hypothetical protein